MEDLNNNVEPTQDPVEPTQEPVQEPVEPVQEPKAEEKDFRLTRPEERPGTESDEVVIPGEVTRKYHGASPRARSVSRQTGRYTDVQAPDTRIPMGEFVNQPTPYGYLEHILSSRDFQANHVMASGKFVGVADYVYGRVLEDGHMMEAQGAKGWDSDAETKKIMAQLYADVMFQLGIGPFSAGGEGATVEGYRARADMMVNDPAFLEYVVTEEGADEIEKGLTMIGKIRRAGGVENLSEEDLAGMPRGDLSYDPMRFGKTEEEYEKLNFMEKVKYNFYVGFTSMALRTAGAVGYKAGGLDFRAEVAPVGEIAGFLGAWALPASAAAKAIKAAKWGSALSGWQQGMISGAIGDLVISNRKDKGFINMISDHMDPDTPSGRIFGALAIEDNDSKFEAGLKAAIEGGILDRAVAGVLVAAKYGKEGVTRFGGQLLEEGMDSAGKALRFRPITKIGRARARLEKASAKLQELAENLEITQEDVNRTYQRILAGVERARELVGIPDTPPLRKVDYAGIRERGYQIIKDPAYKEILGDLAHSTRFGQLMAAFERISGEEITGESELFNLFLEYNGIFRNKNMRASRLRKRTDDEILEMVRMRAPNVYDLLIQHEYGEELVIALFARKSEFSDRFVKFVNGDLTPREAGIHEYVPLPDEDYDRVIGELHERLESGAGMAKAAEKKQSRIDARKKREAEAKKASELRKKRRAEKRRKAARPEYEEYPREGGELPVSKRERGELLEEKAAPAETMPKELEDAYKEYNEADFERTLAELDEYRGPRKDEAGALFPRKGPGDGAVEESYKEMDSQTLVVWYHSLRMRLADGNPFQYSKRKLARVKQEIQYATKEAESRGIDLGAPLEPQLEQAAKAERVRVVESHIDDVSEEIETLIPVMQERSSLPAGLVGEMARMLKGTIGRIELVVATKSEHFGMKLREVMTNHRRGDLDYAQAKEEIAALMQKYPVSKADEDSIFEILSLQDQEMVNMSTKWREHVLQDIDDAVVYDSLVEDIQVGFANIERLYKDDVVALLSPDKGYATDLFDDANQAISRVFALITRVPENAANSKQLIDATINAMREGVERIAKHQDIVGDPNIPNYEFLDYFLLGGVGREFITDGLRLLPRDQSNKIWDAITRLNTGDTMDDIVTSDLFDDADIQIIRDTLHDFNIAQTLSYSRVGMIMSRVRQKSAARAKALLEGGEPILDEEMARKWLFDFADVQDISAQIQEKYARKLRLREAPYGTQQERAEGFNFGSGFMFGGIPLKGMPWSTKPLVEATQDTAKLYTRLKEALEDLERNPESEIREAEVEKAYYDYLRATVSEDDPGRVVLDNMPEVDIPRLPRRGEGESGDAPETIKEWRRRNKLANRRMADDIRKLVGDSADEGSFRKRTSGKNLINDPIRTGLGIAADVRTNNLLYSLGLPILSAVSGAINRIVFPFEEMTGRWLRSFRKTKLSDMHTSRDKKRAAKLRKAGRRNLKEIMGESEVQNPTAFNIAYLLSGGTVDPGDDGFTIFRKMLVGILTNPSRPSRIDADYVHMSEEAMGANLRSGAAKEAGKTDVGGLSRLGELSQRSESSLLRGIFGAIVNVFEFSGKAGLGTIDEGLKTGVFYTELSDKLMEILSEFGSTAINIDIIHAHKVIMEDIYRAVQVDGGGIDLDSTSDRFANYLQELFDQAKKRRPLDAPEMQADVSGIIEMPEGIKSLADLLEYQEAKMLGSSGRDQLIDLIKRAVDEATQQARRITITQDVPKSMEGFVRAVQANPVGRLVSPFTRAVVNIWNMGIERTPLAVLLSKRSRQAMKGQLGEIEKNRALGKMVVGSGLIGIGAALGTEKDGVRAEVVDKGSYRTFVLKIPADTPGFAESAREAIEVFYQNNKEALDLECQRQTGGDIDTLKWLREKVDITGRGEISLEFNRLSPYGMLFEAGMAFSDAVTRRRGMTTKELEQDESLWTGMEYLTTFIDDQGYFDALGSLTRAMENPKSAVESYLTNMFFDVLSPFKGLTRSPGEPMTQTFKASRYSESQDRAMFNTLLSHFGMPGDPDKVMKERDFLGRVVPANDRKGYLLGMKVDYDPILMELEWLGIEKRPTHPMEVRGFAPVDLREFHLSPDMPKEIKDRYAIGDAKNAYEAYLIMTGTVPISRTGTAVAEFENFFNSDDYKTMRSVIKRYMEGDYDETEQYALAEEYKFAMDTIRGAAGRITTGAYEMSAAEIYRISEWFIDDNGESLGAAQTRFQGYKISGAEALDKLFRGDK